MARREQFHSRVYLAFLIKLWVSVQWCRWILDSKCGVRWCSMMFYGVLWRSMVCHLLPENIREWEHPCPVCNITLTFVLSLFLMKLTIIACFQEIALFYFLDAQTWVFYAVISCVITSNLSESLEEKGDDSSLVFLLLFPSLMIVFQESVTPKPSFSVIPSCFFTVIQHRDR